MKLTYYKVTRGKIHIVKGHAAILYGREYHCGLYRGSWDKKVTRPKRKDICRHCHQQMLIQKLLVDE